MAQKANSYLEKGPARHGKKPNQKMKPYIVLQYLLKYSDENNVQSASNIVGFLEECGIDAERRSVYRDIEEINKASWMMENDADIFEAEEAIAADEDDAEKLIVYDKARKGFYVRQRHFDVNDIRLLAECVYSAKFLAEGQAKRLADVVCDFVSEKQAKEIKHDALLTDRVKTPNRAVLNNISTINDAMSRELEGKRHTPEKVSFHYLKYSINDMSQQVERRKGEKYTVSPYALLINDGNYYLLAFDDKYQQMRTYRLDRMKDTQRLGKPRDGEDAFSAIDLKTYTKRVFSMYGGQQEHVTIHFITPLLDAVVDRFGTDKSVIQYFKVDEKHFGIETWVEISEQFFGWLLGFGKRARLVASPNAVRKFQEHIEKVHEMYQS